MPTPNGEHAGMVSTKSEGHVQEAGFFKDGRLIRIEKFGRRSTPRGPRCCSADFRRTIRKFSIAKFGKWRNSTTRRRVGAISCAVPFSSGKFPLQFFFLNGYREICVRPVVMKEKTFYEFIRQNGRTAMVKGSGMFGWPRRPNSDRPTPPPARRSCARRWKEDAYSFSPRYSFWGATIKRRRTLCWLNDKMILGTVVNGRPCTDLWICLSGVRACFSQTA